MLFGLILGLATAAAPATVDLNDLDRWEGDADRFVEGPAGCWEVVGTASWSWDAGRFGLSKGNAVFASTLSDGVWGPFHLEPLGEVLRERGESEERTLFRYEPRWVPLFGEVDEMVVSNELKREAVLPIDQAKESNPRLRAQDERQERRRERRRQRRAERDQKDSGDEGPNNVVREVIDELVGTAAVTSWTQWDDERSELVLYRSLPLDSSKQAEQTVRFPQGGPPTAMDLVFPDTFYRGSLPRVRVSDAIVQMRVRPSGGQLFPTMEAFKVEMGIFGFTVTGAQTIRYNSIQPCASVPVEPVPEPAPADEVPDGESPR